jgi:hypothetical protein
MSQRPARQPEHRAATPVDADALRWPRVDADALRTLPPVLRAVVKALGWGRARDFLGLFGGQVVFVPECKATALGLSEIELARLRLVLAPHLSHTRCVAMPKADKLFLKWRDEEFARDMHGMSNAELARKYKLTTRHVLNLKRQCNGLDDAPGTQPGQLSMNF